MKKAFTLAEILIVLFILGLVSLLTVPSLIDMYKFKIYTAQFDRVYSQLNTAFTQLTQDEMSNSVTDERTAEGLYSTRYANSNLTTAKMQEMYADFLRNYMDVASVYNDNARWPYPDLEYINLNGMSSQVQSKFKIRGVRLFSSDKGSCGKLSQGAVVCVGYAMGGDSDRPVRVHVTPVENVVLNDGEYTKVNSNRVDRGAILVWLDTNGEKKPNVTGYDFFIMQVNTDGTLSEVYTRDFESDEDPNNNLWDNDKVQSYTAYMTPSSECALIGTNSEEANISKAQRAFGCLSRILENGGKVTKF